MSQPNSLQVLSVGGNDESRSELRQILGKIPDFVLAAEATNPSEALQQLETNKIDVALFDLGLSDEAGVRQIKDLKKSHPALRVLVYTASDAPLDIFASMDAGADAYVLKENLAGVIESAIRTATLGAVWLDPGIAKQVLEAMETDTTIPSRILPTGIMRMPLFPDEKSLLSEVAGSQCTDGVCLVDPGFIRKLKRFSTCTV